MIRYRSFRNHDLSGLARLWSLCGGSPGLLQPLSDTLFDAVVLGRPYFDRDGLIVAEEDGHLVGFVHAGFGPSEDGSALDKSIGIACFVVVRPDRRRQGIGRTLLDLAEQYLEDRGSTTIYAGGYRPNTPFYLGLYGYAGVPGVLKSLGGADEFFRSCGYRPLHQILVWERRLKDLVLPFERQQFLIRRSTELKVEERPKAASWWDAAIHCLFDRTVYELRAKQGREVMASATIWRWEDVEDTRSFRGVRLAELKVEPNYRRSGFGTFILSEVCRRLQDGGLDRLQAQVSETNHSVLGLYRKLGFDCIDTGTLYYRSTRPEGHVG